MGISTSYSAQLSGLHIEIVTIEVDISNGLHSFSVVGLGDRAVEESKDRISAAIKNIGFTSPKQKNQKVIISLAPAHVRKEGPSFDLAMALAYLNASGDIELDADNKLFLGELSLDGRIRKIGGVLPILCQAPVHGYTTAFIPEEDAHEASLAQNLTIYAVSHITEIIDHMTGKCRLMPIICTSSTSQDVPEGDHSIPNMNLIRGNEAAKRCLEIAAAGAHNLILCGPPGTGKAMLAHCFRSIVPPLSYEHSLEVTSIYSAAGELKNGKLITNPPFRAPHHTASYPAIVGGGSIPRPGEVTLAHRGILFLDEFPEFDRSVIEALRQPLEDRSITISRARGAFTFPAQCILIATMNPCPCGLGKERGCTCPEHLFRSYRRRLSGPIVDRIDVWATVDKIDYDKLAAPTGASEDSHTIRDRVICARDRQKKRFEGHNLSISYNSEMGANELEKVVILADTARELLRQSATKLGISGRAFHRIIKVAQTIADLASSETIEREHILEALQYRERL
ncbi:MAG: YifB family Mg chelatase-like AAA ATPase [Candidatus Pacebacteria bacterium]|nr:YifB family Mg chelatase-like AAA ATPase [Candidatus Paceibacterota bacterium]